VCEIALFNATFGQAFYGLKKFSGFAEPVMTVEDADNGEPGI
jgi:hypothetical protein